MPCTAIKNADPAGTPGNRTPDKIQRLLNQVAWDTFAVVAHRGRGRLVVVRCAAAARDFVSRGSPAPWLARRALFLGRLCSG